MFLAAFPYFQYRFSSSPWLLAHFPSAIISVSTVTNLVSVSVLTNLQAGASYPSRITASLILNMVSFTLLALSTVLFRHVSAGAYFGFLMANVFAASLATGLCQNGVFAYVSGFGVGSYTQAIMTGQGIAGVLPCIVQIVSVLSVPEANEGADQESPKSAFAYFLTATAVSALALAAFLLVLVRKHGERAGEAKATMDAIDGAEVEEHSERKVVGMWTLFCKLRWMAVAVFLCFTVTMLFPVFTQEIYSVLQADIAPRLRPACFLPLAFLFWNAGDLVGRLSTAKFAAVRYPRALFILSVARFGFIPLYFLCNIHGRGAAVSSDFFYLIVVQFLFGITNGYLGSSCMMGASGWVDASEREAAGGFMGLMLVGGLTAGSLLSFLVS